MTDEFSFGAARPHPEGAPLHPDEITFEHSIYSCEQCKASYDRQLRAFNEYYKIGNPSCQ